uniref:Choline transporter-like protein n=1 Tax=Henneguya salminicola TaxID=69463 RepID=A0A6G3MET9_HENSL
MIIMGFVLLPNAQKVNCCARASCLATFHIILTFLFPIISVLLQLFIFLIWLCLVCCILSRNENEYRFISFEDNNIKIGEICSLKNLTEPSKKCIFAGSYTTYLSTIFIGVFSFISLWLHYLVQSLIVYIIAFLHTEYYHSDNLNFLTCFFFVFKGFYAIILNFGTLVLASLLTTLMAVVLIFFEILLTLLGILASNENITKITSFFTTVLKFLRKFVSFFSLRACIMCVIAKKNFIISVRKAANITTQYSFETFIIVVYNKIIPLFVCPVISVSVGVAAYYHFSTILSNPDSTLFYSICVGFFGFVISRSLVDIYITGIITVHLLACYFSKKSGLPAPKRMPKDIKRAYNIEQREVS